jgi:hypothetical protein
MQRIERFGLRQRPIDVEIADMRKDRLNDAPTRESPLSRFGLIAWDKAK